MATTKKNEKPKPKKRGAAFADDMAKDPNMGFNPAYRARKKTAKK